MIAEYPTADFSVSIVWAAMLGSDDEAAAIKSRKFFDDPRVKQFWDPNLLTGVAYARDVFPTIFKDMAGSLPDEFPMKERLKSLTGTPSTSMPQWDIALFYDKGAKWNAKAPQPKTWVKQLMFFGENDEDGMTGQFYKDSYAKPPFYGDWFKELSMGMMRTTGLAPTHERKAEAASTSQEPKPTSAKEVRLTSLADSVAPLQDHFNAKKDKYRFVALLSPT